MGLGFRADGTLWGISAQTSLFINPAAWSAQQGEEGVLEGKELGLVINEHKETAYLPTGTDRRGMTAPWKCRDPGQTHTHLLRQVFS